MNPTTNRITASGLGGALATLIIFFANLNPPTDVTVAITVVCTFVVGLGWSKLNLGAKSE